MPLANANASISKAALSELITSTLCYPYFLQECGKHSWNWEKKSGRQPFRECWGPAPRMTRS